MKADRKTTKPIGRGKSKTQEAPPTHKAVKPKPHEKKIEGNQEDESVRHNRDLLLALSCAAQAVQRTRTPEQVYRVVGEEIKTLGYSLMIFSLSNDREHLNIAYTTIAANLLRAAEKLTRLPMQSYRLPIQAESIFGRVVAGARAEFLPSTRDTVAQVLPKVLRPLAGQLMTLLKVERGIVAPLCADGATLGVLAVTASVLRETDVPAVEAFAAQVGISLLNARLAQQAQEELEERELAEKDLRESEERFRTLIENASDMIVTITADGNLNYVSPAALRITGYQADEVIGRNIVEFIHADDLPLALQALASRSKISGLAPGPIELRFHHKDGMWRIVEILGNNMLDNPAVSGIVLNVRDVTERKQAEEALRESEERFRSLVEHSHDAITLLTADGTVLYDSPSIVGVLGYNPTERIGRKVFEFVHPEERQDMALGFAKFIQQPGAVAPSEVRFLHKDGTHCVQIEGVRTNLLHEPAVRAVVVNYRDITERKRAEAQIAYQANLLAQVSDSIVASDEQFRLTFWNAASEAMYGWKAEQVLGRNGLEIVRTEWPGVKAEDMRRTIAETGRFQGEATQQRKDGTRFPVEISSLVLHDDSGQITGYVSVNRDITERKRAEEALRHSRDLLNLTGQIAKVGSWELDLETQTLSWTEEVYRIHEVDPSIPLNVAEAINFYAPESQPVISAAVQAGIDSGTPWDFELQLITAKGRRIWVRAQGVAERRDGKTVRLYGAFQDITERKQTEEEVKNSEKRFRALIENGRDNISLLAADGTLLWESPSTGSVLGYAPNQFVGSNIFDLVHPDDQGWTRDLYAQVVQTPGSAQEGAFRLLHDDGTWRWIECSATNLLHDPNVQAIVSNYRDITGRKRMEEALKKSENEYRRLFDNANDVIVIFEPQEEIILEANAAACAAYGYAHDELVGMSLKQFSRNVGNGVDHIREFLAGKPLTNFESVHFNKDGVDRHFLINCALIEYQDRKAIMSINRDVTERKQAEEEIRSQLEELERWQDVMLGRGDREQKLKREVNELCRRAGESARYPSQEIGAEDSETAPAKS